MLSFLVHALIAHIVSLALEYLAFIPGRCWVGMLIAVSGGPAVVSCTLELDLLVCSMRRGHAGYQLPTGMELVTYGCVPIDLSSWQW